MMELKVCALVVTLISSVIANPYGYGVKGGAGASAKAVAGAAAGTFVGDVPVPVPFGNGFSGSFTKSSSSSSSSSSASSSSSSGSFTYNGYGPGGYSSPGSTGNIGCTTGLCQNSGAKDLSGNLGGAGISTGVQGYNIANAAAAAGSRSEANCQGPTCSPNSEKCLSGRCPTNPQLGTVPSIHNANEKCTSGQCGTTSNTGSSIPQYDNLDDIHVIGHTSDSADDSKDQTSHDHKATDDSVSSNCNGGSCGKTSSLNSQPSSAHQRTTLPGQQSPASSTYEASKGYSVPSIHLETPKQDTTCDNGNCDTEHSRPSYDNSLSSYNVPIHGTYDSNKLKPQCQDEKCNSPQKGSYSTTTNSLTTNYLNSQDVHSTKGSYYPGSSSCTGPNCGSAPSGHIGDKPFTVSSTDDQIGLTSPNPGFIKCNSPNCNPHYAVSPTASIVQPGQSNYGLAIDKVSTSTQKLPVYTGGFGAPAGVLSVNPSNPHPSTTLQEEPNYGSASTGCNSPNCLGQSPSPNIHEQPTFGDNKPNEDTKVPIYSGGFGAPAGLLKPNEYDMPAPGISNPIQSVSPIHTTPSSVTTGCKTGNCFGSSNIAGTTSTSNTQSGSYDIHKEHESGNIYTGGFGGPTGMLKPNEFDVKVTTKPEQSTTPSYNSQSTVPATATCKSSNCIGNTATAGTVSGLSVQSGADGVYKPNVIDSSKDLPYTGGFGGPAGLLKPNEFDLPHNSPNYYPSHSVTSQNKVPNYINSEGCSTPNCYPHSVGTPLVTNTQLPSTSCSGSNCGSVPSGYKSGKPSTTDDQFGFLLPNSDPTKCNSPSCNPHYMLSGPTASNVQPGQTNYALPIDKVSTSTHPSTTLHKKPIYGSGSKGCNSPTCFGQPSLPGGIEQPTFNEDKPDVGAKSLTYSGGFGAPTGLLKPNEYDVTGSGISKPIESISPTRDTPSPVTDGCKTGNCFGSSNISGATSTSTTQSGSYGIHKENEGENIYTGGYAEPIGLLIPNKSAGCKTPNCNENTTTDGPVAGADAQSGLNGMIKPSISIDSDSELQPYTGDFGGPAGLLKPNVFEASHIAPNQYPYDSDKSPNKSHTNTNLAGCSTPNCSTHNVVTNIVTNTQSPFAVTKPITLPQLGYTSNYGRPVGVTYPSPIAVAPITLSTALPLTPTYNSGCKTLDCDTYPASQTSIENATFGSTDVNNVQEDSKISNSQHDSDLDVPTISIKPSAHTHTSTSTVSDSTSCQSPDCINIGSTITGSNTQIGSYAGSKQNLPTYTSGFGAPTGLLNPYDKPISASSLKPKENTKWPDATASFGCTSGYCNPKPTSSSSPSHNVATSLGASISSSASASAVAYTGGFGGPPGILKPYDGDKAYVEQNYGKSNINSPYDKRPGTFSTGTSLNTGTTSQIQGQTNFGVLAGSAAGTYSGSGASSDAGLYGYSHHGPHGNDDKTPSPCGGGCGGYQGSLPGSGNSAAAIAKSLSISGGFGLGGSFASSASSAHSSPGSYTKGGYGKR